MKTKIEELEERVEILENTLLESMDKDNTIHKLFRGHIDLLSQRIDLLETRTTHKND